MEAFQLNFVDAAEAAENGKTLILHIISNSLQRKYKRGCNLNKDIIGKNHFGCANMSAHTAQSLLVSSALSAVDLIFKEFRING